MANERNKTVVRFEHKGKQYGIHERSNKLSDGSWSTRRFIFDSENNWCGWANGVKVAREILDGKRDKHTGKLVDIHAQVQEYLKENPV